MARNDADKAAARKKRQLEAKQKISGFSVSAAGPTYYEKLFLRLMLEKQKYGEMDKTDPKRASQRGIVRGLAIAIQEWQQFFGTPEDLTLKEIEARTPWDVIPNGHQARS